MLVWKVCRGSGLKSDSDVCIVMLYHYKILFYTYNRNQLEAFMRLFKSLLLATTILSAGVATAHAEVKVVTSIKPVHSLVAAVMEGVGTPYLIVDGAGSPHT